jgi:drug/metabolite transporter (DMT)-like permease
MARLDVTDEDVRGERTATRPLVGIALKIAATFSFGLMAAIARWIGDAYPLGQIVFFRASFALVPIAALMFFSGTRLEELKTERPLSHLLRSIAGVGAMFSYFAALTYLPLADVTAIGFASPLFVVALAAIVLGEQVHVYRWSAVAVGFVGVLIMVSPHLGAGDADSPVLGLVFAFAASIFTAFAMIAIRRMTATESATAIALYFQLTCAAVSLATLPFAWVTPDASGLLLLMLMGVLGGFGQLFMTNSYRFAQASLIANFDYVAMVWAILFGWLWFSELPAPAVYFGAAIVIGSGLVIAWRERQLGIERATERATKPV